MYFTEHLILVVIATSILDVHCTGILRLKHNLSNGRIVGGNATTIQKYPFQAFLLLTEVGTGDKYQCGGSIVSERCILTAAHCLTGIASVKIRVGSTNANRGGNTYDSSMLTKHPQYNPRTGDYDVGFIKLLKPIKLDGQNTTTVKVPSSNCTVAPGTNLTVTGWGATKENGSTTNTLMEVTIDAVSSTECKKTYPDLTPRMICAGVPAGGKDSCQGDSGGPIIKTGTKTQVGIVSYGLGCARPDTSGVYANLCNPDIQRWLKLMSCS